MLYYAAKLLIFISELPIMNLINISKSKSNMSIRVYLRVRARTDRQLEFLNTASTMLKIRANDFLQPFNKRTYVDTELFREFLVIFIPTIINRYQNSKQVAIPIQILNKLKKISFQIDFRKL